MIPGKQYTPELLWQIAWRRRWLIILPALALATAASLVTHRLPNLYESDTLIMVVAQKVPEDYVRSIVSTRVEDRLDSLNQKILSRTRLERIVENLNLYSDVRRTGTMEDVVERIRRNIDVEVVKGDVFRVGFTAEDPQVAMRVTERLASLFIEENLKERGLLAEGTNLFLESQLENARRQLIETEKNLEAYRRRHDGELPTQVEGNLMALHNVEMQLQSLTESLNRDRDRRLPSSVEWLEARRGGCAARAARVDD